MSRQMYREVREIVVKELKRDLVGPDHGQIDILTEPPSQAYITGILYPLESENSLIEDVEELAEIYIPKNSNSENTQVEELQDEDNSDDSTVSKVAQFKQQNSLGVKFYIDEKINEIDVGFKWGEYSKEKKFDTEKNKEVQIWIRKVQKHFITVPLNISNFKKEVANNIFLIAKKVRIKGTSNYLVSIFLVNQNIDKSNNKAIFQVSMELTHSLYQDVFLCENKARKDTSNFEEFLYKNKPVFAKGYGCAVEWEKNSLNYASKLVIAFIPTHEVEGMSTELPKDKDFIELDSNYFSIRGMSLEENQGIIIGKLKNLADRYENWINKLPIHEADDKTSSNLSISKCRDALERIKEGIEILQTNKDAYKAFQFMNKVMHTQISMKNFSKNQKHSSLDNELLKGNFGWRPFQLAFILLNIKSIVEPNSDDRKIVDLLWFPTGGGKTEAYLGIVVFLLGYRRITAKYEKVYNKDGGVTVILRYTLRLLTTQQRDRLMRLICAAEYIRKDSEGIYGKSEFSIGFWVGGQVTANKLSDLQEDKYYRDSNKVQIEYNKIEKQVIECPCCGSKNLNYQFKPDRATTTVKIGVEIYCINKNCHFHQSHIPVYLVDDEIYRRTPTVIISTVDKFARLPWDEKTANIFGKVNRYCEKCGYIAEGEKHESAHRNPSAKVLPVQPFYPPELIIQDELHLITGPLGTIYGLYETAIEELCSVEIQGQKILPKYVAATATIKNSEEQVKRVFGRLDSQQFPPSGLGVEDSFFGRERSVEEFPFRLYSGICVSGHSIKTVLLRVYAVLLQVTENLLKDPTYADYVDPYRTLIGYFNSVRELGGAVRLLDDDVRKRIQTLQKKYGYSQQRYINRNEELTSRIPSYRIPQVLELLEKETGNDELDVALATNMISVGMDVDRLGLMVVTGQPKQTSEYIQASSRVGRNKPGLVFTVYNPYRPRDLSHYQNFKGYHSRLYHYVEGTTATPFAARARDRALHAVAVSLTRLNDVNLAQDDQAINVKHVNVSALKRIISNRVAIVDMKNQIETLADLDTFMDKWVHLSSSSKKLRYYFYPNAAQLSKVEEKRILARHNEPQEKKNHENYTLDSMRQIEGTSKLFIKDKWC
ncbi:DISARM system helicase DrmA [Brevibacillus laterosporus]|uniref:DISARM system helicase DrmA n=1 Tax=Brevibacillus laterosporus TaxID=1465 RepID=UPI000B9C4DA3|nr:DISARM system helicase DrmA [Brevibacillus laterosporus]